MRFALEHLLADVPADQVTATRDFYRARTPGRGPSTLEELVRIRAGRPAPAPADPPAVEETADVAGRDVPIRIFTPTGGPARGVHLQIPGGGFYLDSAAATDVQNRALAEDLGVAVVSVDYRLAPENPWPAAPDDCETAARWLIANAGSRFGCSTMTIGGTSAGATLAMTTLLRLKDRGEAGMFTGAALQFGTYDLSGQTPAGSEIAGEYFLRAYLGSDAGGRVVDRTVPDISPIFGDLEGLPPVLLVVGDADILLADNLAMAARLSVAGNDVELRIYPCAPHGFTGHPTAVAGTALRGIRCWLGERIN